MKNLLKSLVVLTGLCLSITVFAQGVTAANPKARNVLFVQNADGGTLLPLANRPGYYQLTLDNVKDYVGYFSDRPARASGIYPTNQFVSEWVDGTQANSFNKMPPNAALSTITYHHATKKMVNLPLQLSTPSYNSTTHTMTYVAKVLPGIKASLPLKQMGQTALFIDEYCVSCAG